jgi:arylsulfatase A-like enzyme
MNDMPPRSHTSTSPGKKLLRKKGGFCLRAAFLVAVSTLGLGVCFGQSPSRPNIVLILADDLGYADVGVYGAQGFATPNIDRLAREGMRFRDFHVAQAVCSASRAGLMTGCYPNRVGITGALEPWDKFGLSDKELTLPQILKSVGYATGMVGKWHLGTPPELLPTRRGFDDFFGLTLSNDEWPYHPGKARCVPAAAADGWRKSRQSGHLTRRLESAYDLVHRAGRQIH